ncbi:MAG: Na+/H+ antiporter NhaC family protein [Muribaculum sp.]|nr:Na+/H+ antiporter NhaC family protein [Muribaculum sp.]
MNGKVLLPGLKAISPVAVFLLLYLVVSVIIGDFYKMPLAVALLVASAWAAFILKGRSLNQRVEVFSREAGSPTIMYMIWIFILAGAFAAIAKESGAVDATVAVVLRFLPSSLVIPGLFVASCLISIAIGTSVGTVVALAPLAVDMSISSGVSVEFMVAVVLGGAFFGDNLSFISDTTIAATRTQGCRMRDKFMANIYIVVPAAVMTLLLYLFLSGNVDDTNIIVTDREWLCLPYVILIVTALMGVNVTLVLLVGIVSSLVVSLCYGFDIMSLMEFMGRGIDSVGNLIIITLLAAGMLGLIKEAGGIDFLIKVLSRKVRSNRGAQGCIAVLVGIVNLCTANNTVAILTVGELSRSIAERFGIDPRKSASLLDTCSCVVQSLIPYGAQTLLATAMAGISPVAPWPYMYYAWFLAGMVVLSIVFQFPRRLNR